MRALLVLVGLVALVVVGLLMTGMITLDTKGGSMPSVHVDGGSAPQVKANVATLQVGTENKTVDVPTVGTTQKTVSVPTMSVQKPENGTSAAQ